MNIKNILISIASLLFFVVGVDKFFGFMEPPCSLEDDIPSRMWKLIGVLQISGAILIWMPKFRKYVVGFFAVFMLVISAVHLSQGTYDIGGSVFMAVLLGALVWNPGFLQGKNRE